jgi:hypothetical protein
MPMIVFENDRMLTPSLPVFIIGKGAHSLVQAISTSTYAHVAIDLTG